MTFQFPQSIPIYSNSFFTEENDFWCIDSEKKLLKNGQFFMNLPEGIFFSEDFPLLRKVSQDVCVLVENCNAWLFEADGQIIKHFLVGKGACKIHTQAGKIIVSYGVACYAHGEHRLAIFNQAGALECVFHNLGTEIMSICPKDANTILIQSYGLSSIVELNLFNFSQKHFYCPKMLDEYVLRAMYYHNEMLYLAVEIEPYPKNGTFNAYEISIFKMLLSEKVVDYQFFTKVPYAFAIHTTQSGFAFNSFVLQKSISKVWYFDVL